MAVFFYGLNRLDGATPSSPKIISEDYMKITLPIKTKDEIKDGKRILEYGEKPFELDISLNCQMRWESKFPEQAAKEDLVSYTQRIHALLLELKEKDNLKNLTAPFVISILKTVYCYFDTDITFMQFLKLFDFSSNEHTERLIDKLKEVFEIISSEASEKNS